MLEKECEQITGPPILTAQRMSSVTCETNPQIEAKMKELDEEIEKFKLENQKVYELQ